MLERIVTGVGVRNVARPLEPRLRGGDMRGCRKCGSMAGEATAPGVVLPLAGQGQTVADGEHAQGDAFVGP